MTVKIDIRDGARGEQTAGAWAFDRIALVTGVTGDANARVYNAMIDPAMPDYGDEHPTIEGLYLIDRYGEALSTGVVKVRLVYKRPSRNWTPTDTTTPQIVVGTTLQQYQTYRDINGDTITVSYTIPGKGLKTTGVSVSVLLPSSTLHLVRTEDTNPQVKSGIYSGKVNSAGWAFDPEAPARTWLCTGIVGRSNDGGTSFEVSYDFLHKRTLATDNWDGVAEFIDPTTGQPPPDLELGTGRKIVLLYEEINFNALNLTA